MGTAMVSIRTMVELNGAGQALESFATAASEASHPPLGPRFGIPGQETGSPYVGIAC